MSEERLSAAESVDALLDKYADMATDWADGATQIDFHNFHGHDAWPDVYANIRKAMKLLLDASAQPRWIAVSERLPEDGTQVLFCWWNRGVCCQELGIFRTEEWISERTEGWDDDAVKFPVESEAVTHWMSLPHGPNPEIKR